MDRHEAALMRAPLDATNVFARMSRDFEMMLNRALQVARLFLARGDENLIGSNMNEVKLEALGYLDDILEMYHQWPSFVCFIEARKVDDLSLPADLFQIVEARNDNNRNRNLGSDRQWPPLGDLTTDEADQFYNSWKMLMLTLTKDEIAKCLVSEETMPFKTVRPRCTMTYQLEEHFFVPALVPPTWVYEPYVQHKSRLERYTAEEAELFGLTSTTQPEDQIPLATQDLEEHQECQENPSSPIDSKIQLLPRGIRNPYFVKDPPGFDPNLANFDYFGILFQMGAWLFVIYPIKQGEPATANHYQEGGLTDISHPLQIAWIERSHIGQYLKAEWASLPKTQVGRNGLGSIGTANGEWHFHTSEMQFLRRGLLEKAQLLEILRDQSMTAQAYRRDLFFKLGDAVRTHLKFGSLQPRNDCQQLDDNELVDWNAGLRVVKASQPAVSAAPVLKRKKTLVDYSPPHPTWSPITPESLMQDAHHDSPIPINLILKPQPAIDA